ncbi:hypothetical protein HDV00_012609 [Rhizophlyctis rosea]|nr:hypothetical protein HDV00_012609 [Rhizophlyctis rosea]
MSLPQVPQNGIFFLPEGARLPNNGRPNVCVGVLFYNTPYEIEQEIWEYITVNSKMGDVFLPALPSIPKWIHINCGTGNVSMTDTLVTDLDVQTLSGNVRGSVVVVGDLEPGRVVLNSFTEDVDVEITLLPLVGGATSRMVRVETVSGKCKVKVRVLKGKFSVGATGHGKVRIEGEGVKVGLGENGEMEGTGPVRKVGRRWEGSVGGGGGDFVEVGSGSGDVEVRFV